MLNSVNGIEDASFDEDIQDTAEYLRERIGYAEAQTSYLERRVDNQSNIMSLSRNL
jgi:hypothetical protein